VCSDLPSGSKLILGRAVSPDVLAVTAADANAGAFSPDGSAATSVAGSMAARRNPIETALAHLQPSGSSPSIGR
jgi:hypothetical protein